MAKSLYDDCIERDAFELLVQWDKQKNGALTARDVTRGSHKKVWWKCAFGHQWQAEIYARTHGNAECPYCSGEMQSVKVLADVCPLLVKEWHPTKNHDLTPQNVAPASHKSVWWQCEKGHEWIAEIRSRTKGAKCPVCCNKKIVTGVNDLGTTHPNIAAQWHKEKNGTLTPQSVVQGNHRKVWWVCEKGHEWQATILSRTSAGNGCPVCAGKMVIPGVNDLASQRPHIAAQWHPTQNGDLTAQKVTTYSNRNVWWVCEKGHEYRTIIAHRSQYDSGCPYCKNRKVLAGFNDLATTEPKVASQWHTELNGALTPQMVTAGSHKKVWWRCSEGHIWKAVICSRAGPDKCGCPVCAGKVSAAKNLKYENIVEETRTAVKQTGG